MLEWIWGAVMTLGMVMCVIRTELALELVRRIDRRLARWEQQAEKEEGTE